MKTTNFRDWGKSIMAQGGIIVFFIMSFEVMIMISPFAFFFYSVFNPIFHWLDAYPMTRWLTHFFLPHMILPPTILLKSIRVLGSILFVIGSITFIICSGNRNNTPITSNTIVTNENIILKIFNEAFFVNFNTMFSLILLKVFSYSLIFCSTVCILYNLYCLISSSIIFVFLLSIIFLF